MKGARAGFRAVLVFSVAWTAFLLLRAWFDGDLERTFPDCDPCGFTGYAFRMVIVTGMFLGTFGVPAAVVGWLVEDGVLWIRRKSARGDPR